MDLKGILASKEIKPEDLLQGMEQKIEFLLNNNNLPVFITLSYWSFLEQKPEIWFTVVSKTNENKVKDFMSQLENLIEKEKFSLTEFLINKKISKYLKFELNKNEEFLKILEKEIKNGDRIKITNILNLHNSSLKSIITTVYFIPLKSSIAIKPTIGLLVINTNSEHTNDQLQLFELIARGLFTSIYEVESEYIIRSHAIRSAVAAILTESYAHNIGAHGLEGLKVYLGKQWEKLRISLGLKEDEDEDKDKFLNSVLDALKTKDVNLVKNIIKTHNNFSEYLWYLQGKSAFWSSIARGGALFGGKVISMLQLINEFARNNLLCGSLGASEEFKGIEFYIKFSNGSAVKLYESTIETFKKENVENNLETELEEIKIFMLEGVVGQQAVYTIWENIIRNVKHCKKDTKKLIPFYIEIKNDESKEYVEITCWLDLDSQKEDELSSKVNEMNNWVGILDENQKPNMGGTSQNILCAGMSFGLDYFKTEELQKTNDKKVIKFECNNRVKYNFKIWKGKDVGRYQDIANKTIEEIGPLGRFKIIQLKNEDEKNALLKNSFFLRHTIWEKDESGGENIFPTLYQKWINEWFELNQKEINIKIQERGGYFKNLDRQQNNSNSYTYYFYHGTPHDEIQNKSKIVIAYKNDDVIGEIINKIDPYQPQLQDLIAVSELLEILETSIEIFDKRLYNLANEIKNTPSLQELKVQAFPEEEEKIPKDDHEKIHFGIFHLSFIELITGEKNDKAIAEFLEKYPHLNNRYKIIIITTGRGRDWWSGLNDELKMKIKFIPIENLENCFDKTLAPKTPSIGVKYALVKTIFGS